MHFYRIEREPCTPVYTRVGMGLEILLKSTLDPSNAKTISPNCSDHKVIHNAAISFNNLSMYFPFLTYFDIYYFKHCSGIELCMYVIYTINRHIKFFVISFQRVNEIVDDFNLKYKNIDMEHNSKCVRFEVNV